MPTLESLGLDRLPAEERLALADALYDSVAQEESAPITEPQRAELARRLAKSTATPGAGTPWEVAEARALERIAKR